MTAAAVTIGETARFAVAARRAIEARAQAARLGRDGDWRNLDVRAAFVAVADRIVVDTVRPGLITATAPRTHNGRLWAYIGYDALRAVQATHRLGGTITSPDDHTFALAFTLPEEPHAAA